MSDGHSGLVDLGLLLGSSLLKNRKSFFQTQLVLGWDGTPVLYQRQKWHLWSRRHHFDQHQFHQPPGHMTEQILAQCSSNGLFRSEHTKEIKNMHLKTRDNIDLHGRDTLKYDCAFFFTFPWVLLNSFVVPTASMATGSRSAWYSAKITSMSASFGLWSVAIQLARVTASWMAVKAPAPPEGFN